jgi:hypothetical protein
MGLILNRRFGVTCLLHLQGRRNNASEEKCQMVTNRPLQFGETESTDDIALEGRGGGCGNVNQW